MTTDPATAPTSHDLFHILLFALPGVPEVDIKRAAEAVLYVTALPPGPPSPSGLDAELIRAWRECFGAIVCRNRCRADVQSVERFWQLMNRFAGIASPDAVVPPAPSSPAGGHGELLRNEKFCYDEATVERVAKAISVHRYSISWSDMAEPLRNACLVMARSAIAAMAGEEKR